MKHRPANSGSSPTALRVQHFETWLQEHVAWTCLFLYVVALALRVLYLLEYRHTLLARVLLMDEAYYHAEAWNLIRGAANPTDSYFMTPLYPLFLSVVFRVVGDGPTAPYAVQLALGALLAPLVYGLTHRCMRPVVALLAGLACASFAPFVFFEALFLVEWIVMLCVTGALFFAARDPSRLRNAVAAGVLLGIATLGRGSNILLVVPLALWFGWASACTRARMSRVATFAGAVVLVLAPLFIYNASNARQPLLLTANAGFNLYLGNGPEATGIFQLPERLDLAQDPLALRYVQRETQEPVTASEASHFWLDRTWQWVRAHPGRTLQLFAWKLVLFWNRFSFPQVEGMASIIGDLRLSRFPFWSSYLVFPLALLGALTALFRLRAAFVLRTPDAARARTLALVAACAFVYSLSIAMFFITDRYRIPILPALVVLALYFVYELIAAIVHRRRVRLLLLLLAFLVSAFLTSPDRLAIDRRRIQRDLHVHDALRLAKGGLLDDAVREYQKAHRIDPDDPGIRDGLARMHSRAGNDSLAAMQLRQLLREHPDAARSWYNLGNVYRRLRLSTDATNAYRRALALEPKHEAAWNNLGEAYRALGDTAQAAAAYLRALEIVPAHEQALNNLAALRGFQGNAEAAERGFRAAIQANRRYLPAWRNLAILLTNNGRFDEALAAWRQVLVLDPHNDLALQTIGQIEDATFETP